ncbi:MAG: hypothetical protein R3A52_32865 [Polyangiales bacterium]
MQFRADGAIASGDADLDRTPEFAVSIGARSAPDAVEINRGRVDTPRSIMGTDGVATMASQIVNPVGMNITLFGYIR